MNISRCIMTKKMLIFSRSIHYWEILRNDGLLCETCLLNAYYHLVVAMLSSQPEACNYIYIFFYQTFLSNVNALSASPKSNWGVKGLAEGPLLLIK